MKIPQLLLQLLDADLPTLVEKGLAQQLTADTCEVRGSTGNIGDNLLCGDDKKYPDREGKDICCGGGSDY